ncbi:hypothetical protein B4100_0106 [Heyndrickxia coagulans]|nr:hypothetical protein B4100_0106 [Heyndrickxia coagulans]
MKQKHGRPDIRRRPVFLHANSGLLSLAGPIPELVNLFYCM